MRSLLLPMLLVLAAGCPARERTAQAPPASKVELVAVPPDGDVAPYVKTELERAAREGKRLLVYVGAPWCEPCRKFHAAAAAGQLDAHLPNLRLLEFNADRDSQRLAYAGYMSDYIPLFARPNSDGRASGKQTEGGSPTDVVGNFVPRLKTLLQ